MASSNETQELIALVTWLQTFDGFPKIVDSKTDVVLESLSSLPTSRAIWNVAEEVCGSTVEDDGKQTSAEEIWTSLLILTSTRARPVVAERDDEKMTPFRLKLYVLSNLLDCAVQAPQLDQRRQYIQRIMKLPKAVQKTLMALIEKRKPRSKSKSPQRPSSSSKSSPQRPSSSSGKSSSSMKTPPSALRSRSSDGRVPHSTAKIYNSGGDLSTPYAHTPLSESNNNKTTPTITPILKKSSHPTPTTQLTPGTMDSPAKMQSIVHEMRVRNEQLSQVLDQYKARVDNLSQQIESLQNSHRQQMLQLETAHIDQQHEAQERFEQKLTALQVELKRAQETAAQGQAAMQELSAAKEELELMEHKSSVLNETSEKLRKYKEKVAELQDVKETLQREQDSHAKAVNEIVRLENELQALQPIKRQVEDYKIRAIEAEVKLVECQDYLQRLEQKAKDQSIANEYLWQGAVMQKEQLEELQRRVQNDTQQTKLDSALGDGVSELNPELMEEVTRLRNENEQLKAFAAKRDNDAVEQLESELDDSKRLADRYKEEYLDAKNALAETKSKLEEAEARAANLEVQIEELKEQLEVSERHGRNVTEKLNSCEDELKETKLFLAQSEKRVVSLETDVQEWTVKANEAESKASERLEKWQNAQQELDETCNELTEAGKTLEQLREEMRHWEAKNKELEEVKGKLLEDLRKTQESLSETRQRLAESHRKQSETDIKLNKLHEEKAKLQMSLEDEKQAKHEAAEEAHRSLQATRQVLLAKSQKELEEVQGNMNCLLDDERRANRRKDEEHKREMQELNAKWKKDYDELQERLAVTVKHSREEAQDRLSYVKQEYETELDKVRKEAEEERKLLLERGRGMLADTRAKAEEEKQNLEDKLRSLQHRFASVEQEKEEVEKLLRSKISTYKQKLESSTSHISELTRETDDLQELVKSMEREKYKLQEENDRYRRQLGGMYGADGQIQSQLEKLQKEYNAVLQENRNLKSGGRHSHQAAMMPSISEDSASYSSRGASSRGSSISQLRREYEEMIETLNDEKRELIMKNSAAVTDVQKAEQRAWEREQEIAQLKEQIDALKLSVARVEYAQDRQSESTSKDLSFLTAEEMKSPVPTTSSSYRSRRSYEPPRTHSRSPSLDRAMRNRAEQEANLRSRISSLAGGTPPRMPRGSPGGLHEPSLRSGGDKPEMILTPTRRHEHQSNRETSFSAARRERERESLNLSKMTSEVYGFGGTGSSGGGGGVASSSRTVGSASTGTEYEYPSLMDFSWEGP